MTSSQLKKALDRLSPSRKAEMAKKLEEVYSQRQGMKWEEIAPQFQKQIDDIYDDGVTITGASPEEEETFQLVRKVFRYRKPTVDEFVLCTFLVLTGK